MNLCTALSKWAYLPAKELVDGWSWNKLNPSMSWHHAEVQQQGGRPTHYCHQQSLIPHCQLWFFAGSWNGADLSHGYCTQPPFCIQWDANKCYMSKVPCWLLFLTYLSRSLSSWWNPLRCSCRGHVGHRCWRCGEDNEYSGWQGQTWTLVSWIKSWPIQT